MAAGHLGTVAITAVVLFALLGGATAQTLSDPKNNVPECNGAFNTTLQVKYVQLNDSACANAIYSAFSITTPAQCPPTQVGSFVHQCMNKNNTGGYTDLWATLISGCEYMYIANRKGSSESETGFTFKDDSCFQRFDSWSAFNAWLRNAVPYGGQNLGGQGNAAGIARIAVGTVAAALMFAFMLLLQ